MKAHFILGHINPEARKAYQSYTRYYGQNPPEKAELAIVLGGDGCMLTAVKEVLVPHRLPGYGVNFGGVGFLLNPPPARTLLLAKAIESAVTCKTNPLRITATDLKGKVFTDIAINDIAISHERTEQAIDLTVCANGVTLIEKMRGDGLVVSTRLGALCYNGSAGGVLPPFQEDLMMVTPICQMLIMEDYLRPFAMVNGTVSVQVLTPDHRQTRVVADNRRLTRSAASIEICRDMGKIVRLMHNKGRSLPQKYSKKRKEVLARREGFGQRPLPGFIRLVG